MCSGSRPVAAGPLAAYAEGFRAALTAAGYAPATVGPYGRLLPALSGWLASNGVAPAQCTEQVLAGFTATRRTPGQRVEARALRPLLAYLRAEGVVPPALLPAALPRAEVLAVFARYLAVELTFRTSRDRYGPPLQLASVEL
jgi:hypothetical protein